MGCSPTGQTGQGDRTKKENPTGDESRAEEEMAERRQGKDKRNSKAVPADAILAYRGGGGGMSHSSTDS
jgi:hypothetical protein